ncbi:MAG TPA: BBP7 family outer membrane beta-barrel protein, partial [Gemmataceae bacterium]|nr:BBP7 family outer membrane beta-barrel protein [Gemmataceae bacterium]
MRKGILGSIAALAVGAGTAWGQKPAAPVDPPPPAALGPAAVDPGVIPANGPLLPPGLAGLARTGPAPVIMPPIAVGPPGDPQGLGPVGGYGPPPGPMYPPPGPYAAPLWQPAAPGPGAGGGAAAGTPGAAPHVWTTFDYLLYFAKAQPIRFPLVTTSAPSDAGLLGRPSTLVIAGQDDLSYNPLSGFRITSGFFGDCDRRFGFEGSGFLL